MSRTSRWFLALACLAAIACEKVPPASSGAPVSPGASLAKPEAELEKARLLSNKSEYAAAEKRFETLLDSPLKGEAWLELGEVYLVTGRYTKAVEAARAAASSAPNSRNQATLLGARAERAAGDLKAARARLSAADAPKVPEAQLLLGEILLEQGQRDAAEPVLMTLIDAYNEDRVSENDGAALALVGRAAHLLRAARDANDAFNMAESAKPGHLPTLLWRAELFLEKHDPGHAEAVVREVLAARPHEPDALVALANVRLVQAYDFDEAERLARRALGVNPKHPGAHAVLAGIALRDMELGLADERVKAGLAGRPGDLELSSLGAAVRFLADDEPGFRSEVERVIARSPGYSKVYQIVGEYAEWEHRYEDIVQMMEEAVRIDPGDANAHAALGLNLIRAGEDAAGIVSLRAAFDLDPFNVRVFNTLNLYEKTIPNDYVSVEHGRFRIRYPKAEQALLDRYVPGLLERAFRKMVEHYGFEPEAPIGIELYASREHFSVRTSGLPNTAIQGVCFGHTLASMSLAEEKFNLGMTLWHELAHVFHIQQSKYHVPRWFTEGLAEYETIIEREEWAREQDPDLFEALRSRRLPELLSMSRAFTRAEQPSDVATAYYASSKILGMLVEQHGMQKMARMLEAWGAGQRSEAVLGKTLGVNPSELDTRFREHTARELGRYASQFMPLMRAEPLDKLEQELEAAPKNGELWTRLAVSAFRQGKVDQAEPALKKALELAPKQADAVYLAGLVELEHERAAGAVGRARELVAQGRDGYFTQLLLAEGLLAEDKKPDAEVALDAANRFDPTQADPLAVKAKLARANKDPAGEIEALSKLAKLEQHTGGLYARLLELLGEAGQHEAAVQLGEAALWADLSSFDIHFRWAKALLATGDKKRAAFEFESATLCDAPLGEMRAAHSELIKLYRALGQAGKARAQEQMLKALEANPKPETPGAIGEPPPEAP